MTETPVANVDQAEAWNGDEGRYWTAHRARFEAMGPAFTDALVAAADLTATDVVLDVGCGTGLTARLAAAQVGRGRVVGLDLSSPMIDHARQLAASDGITNVSFQHGDAQVHPLPTAAFDVAISRFGVMFFDDPRAALANIGAAIRTGGRLVFTCWQDMAHNDWLMVPASAALQHVPFPDLGDPGGPGPFSLADPAHIQGLLAAAGFDDIDVHAIHAPVRLGADAHDAAQFLAGMGAGRALLDGADPDTATRAIQAVTEALRPYQQPGGVLLNGAAWLATARCRRHPDTTPEGTS